MNISPKRGRIRCIVGFSLAELLISILILSTLSVLLVGVIPASVIGLRAAAQRANAAQLGREVMEDLKRDGFGLLPAVGNSITLPVRVVNETEYTLLIHIVPAEDSGHNVMDDSLARAVEVEVRWRTHVGAHDENSQKSYTARQTFYKQI